MFIDFPPREEWHVYDHYRSRWLTEAIEGGDVVIPYQARRTLTGQLPVLRFAVFAAGLPQDAIEGQLRATLLRWERYEPEEIDAVIETYRDRAGLR